MTPQEKAKELIQKYIPSTQEFSQEMGWQDDWQTAKQASIICIDEIIEAIESFGYSGTFYDCPESRNMICSDDKDPTQYWLSVKQELEKL